jgi:arsenate reductase (glutaredoxin)
MMTGMNHPITLYGIPHCDTVKKARAWLALQGIEHNFYNFKTQGVPTTELAHWVQALGWEKLLNRQGTTWRKLDANVQAGVVDAASAMALMQTQPSVIKRPVVAWNAGDVTVGFDLAVWAHRV